MKVVAFVPAKGSSERVPNKNTALLDGKPLLLHTLEKLAGCDFIDEVYLDSESDEIHALASHLPIRLLKRDPALASNATDGHALFLNEVRHVEADVYIQVLCTSPFIEPATIRRGIDILRNDGQHDSVVLVKNEHLYCWRGGAPAYGSGRIPNSVDLPWTTIETMGMYIVRRETALRFERRFGERPYLLEALPIEAVDVNTPEEFALADMIASGKREKERHLLRSLQNQLTSSMLSDILDQLGVDGVVTGLTPNIVDARVFGRAKTLKLRALKEGEDEAGIYQALQSYRTIVPNDVIIVENELADYAYFGDLNAHLAIRSGAVGAIIDGRTRDSNKVIELGFPVFSRGTTCTDVRGRATLECFNRPIRLGRVEAHPHDLVFADPDGIVVVPKHVEREVLDRAVRVIDREASISLAIALGRDVDDIVRDFGMF